MNWFDLVHKFDHRSSLRKLNLILKNKTIYLVVFHHDHDSLYFTYTCNLSCLMYTGHTFHVNNNNTTCYIYIYFAYTLFFLFLPLSAYLKPRTAFHEEREDDEDIYRDYDDSDCLNWKEILSQINNDYQVNSFLIEPDVLLNENFILPKSMHLCMIRFIDNTSVARGGGELQQEGQALISNINKCAREEREACALGGNEEITYEQEREMAHQELHV